MTTPNWVVVKQDLTTLVCNRCGSTYKIYADMKQGIPVTQYTALLGVGCREFGRLHAQCRPNPEINPLDDNTTQEETT